MHWRRLSDKLSFLDYVTKIRPLSISSQRALAAMPAVRGLTPNIELALMHVYPNGRRLPTVPTDYSEDST